MNDKMKGAVMALVGVGLLYGASLLPGVYNKRMDSLREGFENSRGSIVATVQEEINENGKYSLNLLTDDGKTIGLNVRDYICKGHTCDKTIDRSITASSLDALIEPGTRISFPISNVTRYDVLSGLIGFKRETDFTHQDHGAKYAPRVKILDAN